MNVTSVIRMFAGVAGLLFFWNSGARAQSEVNPDQFDALNTEHFPQPKVKESAVVVTEQRFSGTFMLPYTLECAGKRLLAGHYSFSLRSDGKTGRVTLNQKAQRIEIAGAVQKQARNPGPSALYVGLSGNARRLLAVHLAELDLVFDVDQQIRQSTGGKPARVEKLALLLAGPQK
jgi:hypothetical protein